MRLRPPESPQLRHRSRANLRRPTAAPPHPVHCRLRHWHNKCRSPDVPLHLIKLCVGCDSAKDLEDWIRSKLKERKRRGLSREHIHRTRMVPKRADELRHGGSLYWVIRGEVTCRQRLLDVRPFVDKAGMGRCQLVLDPKLILVEPRPWRPFQGWR